MRKEVWLKRKKERAMHGKVVDWEARRGVEAGGEGRATSLSYSYPVGW